MNRILAIQVKQIGDVILTLPALRVLRRHYPDAHITYVVRHAAAGLAPLFDCVDEVVGVGDKGVFDGGMWRHVCLSRFDVAFDFSGTDRARFLCWLSGAGVRLGYFRHRGSTFGRKAYTDTAEVELGDFHTTDYFIRLLGAAGIPAVEEALSARLPEEVALLGTRILEGRLRDIGLELSSSKVVVVHAGTARGEKYWEPPRWAEVIRHAAACGFVPVLTGGRDAHEAAHVEEIKAGLDGVAYVDLVGGCNLLESASVIAGCDLFLGVDTAALHLASAFRRPLVGLFGPTSPYRWRPRNPEARTVLSGEEYFVTRFRKDDEEGEMQGISTGAVIGAMDSLLG